MKAGDKIVIMPSGAPGEIKSIETHHTEMPSAEAGDNIGFNLRGVEKKDIKRGDVMGTPDAPPKVAKEFKAQIIVIHHPTATCTRLHSCNACTHCTSCCNTCCI